MTPYEKGRDDHRRGFADFDCPYQDPRSAAEWYRGWLDGLGGLLG